MFGDRPDQVAIVAREDDAGRTFVHESILLCSDRHDRQTRRRLTVVTPAWIYS